MDVDLQIISKSERYFAYYSIIQYKQVYSISNISQVSGFATSRLYSVENIRKIRFSGSLVGVS
jgi:hypothetical protein